MSKLHFANIERLPKLLSAIEFSSLFVLVDSNTKQFCYPLLSKKLPQHTLITVEAGEKNKTLTSCAHIWQELSDQHADRKALLLNLGGGVITDMGGFCASTYKRGILFINVPTTLLAQVDASVGGKTGIDFLNNKNQIGVFNEPEFVLIDSVFHETLPENELRSGFAEMLKHGLIADVTHWEDLVSLGFKKVTLDLIKNSIAIKQKVVENDPKEAGLRKILNFGHTVGHAIESIYLEKDKPLLHGEAIALGMKCEAYIAHRLSYISEENLNKLNDGLNKYYADLRLEEVLIKEIVAKCKQDKKNDYGKVKMSLLNKLGEANYDISVSEEMIITALNRLL